MDSDKHYRVEAKLGIKTLTGDAEGEVIATKPVTDVTQEKITSLFKQFSGLISQIPPMFSALKYQGKPLYELARKGIEVERKPREVMIHALELISYEQDKIIFTVHCSKGTYIRTLVEDIGEALGSCAYVSALHRTAVSPYPADNMYHLEELEALQQQSGPGALINHLLPIDTSVQHLPSIKLSSSGVFYIRTGQPVRVPQLPTTGLIRIFADDNRFMGVGEVLDDGRLAPRRLIF